MGFFCSSLWCKLYLLSYEIKFIQRLAKLWHTKIMSIFKYVLGTLLTYVGSMWGKLKFLTHYNSKIWIIHYIYTPSEVSQFSTSSLQFGIKAHFINVFTSVIDKQTGKFLMRNFDKRCDLLFKYSQYINFKSNKHMKHAYNVVISQTIPILYISNCPLLAMHEIHALINILTANGTFFKHYQCLLLHWTTKRY